jgi:zinc transport system permease protein
MALFAALIGALSVVIGLRAAYVLDTPAGPSIVCVAAIAFAALSLLRMGDRRGA